MDYKKLLESKEYDFLRTDEHLGKNILFLCLGGSHSYGTNIETSDVDIRGVALNSESDVLGLTQFEQREDKATDTVIYSLNKFIKLVSECNPNIIEMLFCKPEHYLYVSPLGKLILDNRHLFLTKRAYYTFGGYAYAQLNRLENALVRDSKVLSDEETEEHISRSVNNCLENCKNKLGFDDEAFKIYVGKDSENNPELKCDVHLDNFPMSNFRVVLTETSNVVRDYKETVGAKNKKKDDLHLNKHMMHLIRLYFMCNEILSEGTLHTYREKEHDLLMDIRNGKYRDSNGGVKKEFYELLDDLKNKVDTLKDTTTLPRQVDKNLIYEKILRPIYSTVLFK